MTLSTSTATLLAMGDLIIDEPQPETYFAPARARLAAADVVLGHLEVPFTLRRQGTPGVPLEARDPAKLGALADAGIHAVSLSANHLYDEGEAGVRDTLDGLSRHGIQSFGAGRSLAEARQPLLMEARGVRFGFLSYNLVGPKQSWAGPRKAGGAYVHVLTQYELDHATPGGTPTIFTGAEAESLLAMADDIQRLRPSCDVLCVSMHKGTVHTPALVMAYEKQVAHAAVDAGADAVFGHHAHILRGIEVYRGKPIYHGLGNFVTVTHALSPTGADTSDWARRRLTMFGFVPDPETPEYPFHPESRHSVLARLDVRSDGAVEAGYLPVLINRQSQPVVVGPGQAGQDIFAYVQDITRRAGFQTRFGWRGDGDGVAVLPADEQPLPARSHSVPARSSYVGDTV
jgi:poly-gamma-glutamate capsule biosynthesis protein CapA/YwtB (metallophosphatase superfamily)